MARYKHGYARRINGRPTPEYATWTGMLARCTNKNCKAYPRYGGRGITVCEEWRTSFSAFLAHVGDRPAGCCLYRIEKSKGYEPGNVRWSTPREDNRRRENVHLLTLDGVTRTLPEWSEHTGISRDRIYQRIAVGNWSFERALLTPVRGGAR